MTTKNKKKIYKLNYVNFGKLLGLVILSILLFVGVISLFKNTLDYVHTKKVISEVKEKIKVENVVDDDNTKKIEQDKTLSKFDIYWDYVKLGLIDVDMAELKKMNVNSIGYIDIKGTDFSYPVLSNTDAFYKTHSYDKKKNSYGWIYLKDDSTLEELPTNTVIYGNKKTGNVLASNMNEVFKKKWQEDTSNFLVRYVTSNYSGLFQIISVYHSSDKYHETTEFNSDEKKEEFLDKIIAKSEYKFKTKARKEDKILTITTNSKGRNTVIHAKLIKVRTEE